MVNPATNNTDRTRDSSKRRKRKKSQSQRQSNSRDQNVNRNLHNTNHEITNWRSEDEQEVYSSKLLQALRNVRLNSGTGTGTGTGRAVRETADRVLAVAAKGRTRWSRAILKNKLKLRFMKSNRRWRGLVATAAGNSRLRKPRVRIPALEMKRKELPAAESKSRVLGGLVPGCRKQPLPVVLEEASNYIPALEMQVKAMTALVELLSGGSSSRSSAVTSATVSGTGIPGQFSFSRPPPCL